MTKYKVELEFMFNSIIAARKFAYEEKIVKLAAEMGIKQWDKQDICNFSDLQHWAVHHSNHGNHRSQIDVLETLTTMFFCKLDSVGQDYWLDRAVNAWTAGKNIVVDHDINFPPGNIIFGSKQASNGLVKSLFKRGNLDYHIIIFPSYAGSSVISMG